MIIESKNRRREIWQPFGFLSERNSNNNEKIINKREIASPVHSTSTYIK